MLAALLFLAIQISPTGSLGFTQSVAVKGRLMCNGVPAGGVVSALVLMLLNVCLKRLKLYDVDTFDLDDLMAEGYSDRYGYFFLSGQEREFTSIDPKLNM